MKLRPYQLNVIKELYEKVKATTKTGVKKYRKILIVAPTGAGKTVISTNVMETIAKQGKRVLFLVHRDKLVQQTAETLNRNGLECGYIKSGYTQDSSKLIQVASIQTLAKRSDWKNWDFKVCIIDESHIVAFAKIVRETLMKEIFPNILYIGLTGTPYRLSKREGMGDIFQAMVCTPLPAELMEMGYLVKPVYYGLPGIDLTGVKVKGGEFVNEDLRVRCDLPEVNERIVREWFRLSPGKRTICFCVDQEHAKNLAEAFRKYKVPTIAIDSNVPFKERDIHYENLRSGKLLVITSVDCLSEGFDEPSAEVAILARPTHSRALFEQQVGRVLRISPNTSKEQAWILDPAGNVKRFGYIEDKTRYMLTKGSEPDEENPTPLKECPTYETDKAGKKGCGTYLYGFQMVCPSCGFQFEKKDSEVTIPNAPLVRLVGDNDKKYFDLYQGWLRTAFQNNQSPGIAYVKLKGMGKNPKQDWGRCAIFSDPIPYDYLKYWNHLEKLAKLQKKDESWIKRWMTIEFGKGWEKMLDWVRDKYEDRKLEEIGLKEGDQLEILEDRENYLAWINEWVEAS